MSRQRGYTLVEVLIAVTVFSVLAGSVYLALNSLSAAAFVQRERSAELAELQLAMARLESDLRQLASRPVRGADGQLEPALFGRAEQLEGTRAGWSNPLEHGRGQLQRFGWSVDEQGLTRRAWPATDRTPRTNPVDERVGAGLQVLEFRYYGAEGRWLEQWPESASPDELPRAIRYWVETERFGRIERTVVLP